MSCSNCGQEFNEKDFSYTKKKYKDKIYINFFKHCKDCKKVHDSIRNKEYYEKTKHRVRQHDVTMFKSCKEAIKSNRKTLLKCIG